MTDWSKADWIDPEHPWTNPMPVPAMPERLLVDFATRCNLRCPMCPVWGSGDERAIDSVTGIMTKEHATNLLDEVAASQPMIAPSLYGEPLLIPKLKEVFSDLKRRNLPLVLNSNGLTLTDEIAQFFVDIKLDSIMFSLDSTTKETLKKVRGVDKLEKIERNVHRMLRIRGDSPYPRVGVSYTVQQDNEHEVEDFAKRWVGVVDVVRIGLVFDSKTGMFPEMKTSGERKPCPALYKTLPVHNDGTAPLCCLDGFRASNMGNVFKDGVAGVWHGEEFAKARYYHETAQWDKVPFCKSCNGWAEYDYEEEVRDGILIRKSPQYIYYNKIERLTNWQGRLLGGHEPPPAELLQKAD
jgi:MoaA/NifB/PqqE/SkfB family radical SAM enzyme